MRKTIYILFVFFAGVLLSSCEDTIEKVVITTDPSAPVISGPSAEALSFTKTEADNEITFNWSAADFGFEASIAYTLQLSVDADFTVPVDLFTTYELQGTKKVSDLNNILISMELPLNEVSTLYTRVKASINENVDPIYSAVVSFSTQPYETLIDYPVVYLPGDYQGWAPDAEEINHLYSYNFNDIYENILTFETDAQFKITPAQSWDFSYGDVGSGVLSSDNAPNFSVTAGTYKMVADLANLTYTIETADIWGVIGSSIPPYDWSADVKMTYDGQRRMWEITGDFKAGEFKFRANNAWDLNYGDTSADATLDAGGDNIVLAADGNYTIRLDLENLTYFVIMN